MIDRLGGRGMFREKAFNIIFPLFISVLVEKNKPEGFAFFSLREKMLATKT